MHDDLTRAGALFGSLLLFILGFGWYLSMGLWNFPTQAGFQAFTQEAGFQALYETEPGPHTLTFPFSDPKTLEGRSLYRGSGGSIIVTRVDNITDTTCRIWFRADGSLGRGGGTLVSACLPQWGESQAAPLLSSLLTEPQIPYHAYLSNYDGDLGERGNQFAVTVFRDQAEDHQEAPAEVCLIFPELQKVTFTQA
ncbi:MAG: hypothetical protein Q4C76_06225 [Bacillota bacterium]|nr:hypothetical protein [Bacillota bacterium]